MKIVDFTIPVTMNNSIHFQEDRLPYFYEHLHRHLETQVTWVVNGEGTFITGNYMQRFHMGDLFVVGANQPHLFKSDPCYFEEKSDNAVHTLNIFFDPKGFLAQLLTYPELRSIKNFIDVSSYGMKASEKDKNILTELILKIKNTFTGFRLSSFIELLQVMANLKNWEHLSTVPFEQAFSDSEGLRMNDVYQYTMANFTDSISLEQIAAVAYLTPQSFCRYFKKHTSKTYINFLNEVRINAACKKFMEKKFHSISTVAYQSGFNNVVTFNRVFKSITGIAPREFIKAYHDKE